MSQKKLLDRVDTEQDNGYMNDNGQWPSDDAPNGPFVLVWHDHRNALVHKDLDFYSEMFPDAKPSLSYWWPTQNGY